KYAYAANYDGFTVYDPSDPTAPAQGVQVYCPGSLNTVSVYNNTPVLSTDSSPSDDSSSSTPMPATANAAWEGIKIWDISDPLSPRYVKSIESACGSHTHSLAPSKNGKDLYAYVSSYSPNATFPDCQPPHDFISIVKIPVKQPTKAQLVAT